jgi:2-polyprenyl-3-methyl-5-hydroxy-6-metoxy-1,4-benzoquinol methylase
MFNHKKSDPSFVRNTGQVSYTYQDSGIYGQFINQSRLDAYQYALEKFNISRDCIIDVGCSYGSWAENWRSLGFKKLCGVEPNQNVITQAKEKFDEVYLGYASDLKSVYPSNLVMASNGVLVHILEREESIKFLHNIQECLSTEGLFLFTVINAKYYYSSGRTEWIGPNSCTRYLETWRQYCEQANLEILEGGEIGTFIDPWAIPDLDYIAINQELRQEWPIYKVFIDLANNIRSLNTSPFSEILFVTRRKM